MWTIMYNEEQGAEDTALWVSSIKDVVCLPTETSSSQPSDLIQTRGAVWP